jgi:hypothetical protein
VLYALYSRPCCIHIQQAVLYSRPPRNSTQQKAPHAGKTHAERKLQRAGVRCPGKAEEAASFLAFFSALSAFPSRVPFPQPHPRPAPLQERPPPIWRLAATKSGGAESPASPSARAPTAPAQPAAPSWLPCLGPAQDRRTQTCFTVVTLAQSKE